MSAASLPGARAGAHRASQTGRTGRAGVPRLALGLAAVLAAIALSAWVLREAMAVRSFEAWLSGHVIPLTGIQAGDVPGSPIVWFAEGPHRYMGLFISGDCTIDALIVPFTLGTAWVVWRRARIARPLAGLAVAVALLFAMNQFRLLLIVLFTVHLARENGFYWGHTIVGSMVTIFGIVLIFIIYSLIAVRRKGTRLQPMRPEIK